MIEMANQNGFDSDEYYQMTPKTCFLCQAYDGKVMDEATINDD